MYQYNIYIGSDNSTGKIDSEYRKKIIEWANSNFKGYTLIEAKGYYNGAPEDSILLSVISENNMDISKIIELKKELNQKEILITKNKVSVEFV